MKTRKYFLIGGIVIAIAFGFLAWKLAGQFSSFQYTVGQYSKTQADLGTTVSQFIKGPANSTGTVSVHGWVGNVDTTANLPKFTLTDGQQNVQVTFSGPLPTFVTTGKEVVVEGKAVSGSLQATKINTTKEVRVEGPLSTDVPVKYDVATRTATFALTGTTDSGAAVTLPVSYTGTVPDTFYVDPKTTKISVVVIGRQGPNGIFLANNIETKCASKYQAPPTTTPAAAIAK